MFNSICKLILKFENMKIVKFDSLLTKISPMFENVCILTLLKKINSWYDCIL